MATGNHTPPPWLVVRLGEDFNWWIDHTGSELDVNHCLQGVLDPRQVAHLVETLDQYTPYGLTRILIKKAFLTYTLESELPENRLRLALTADELFDGADALFALPRVHSGEDNDFHRFLDALSSAHIRRLNATHHYARNCTEDEMLDELDCLDSNRYFNEETIHVFEEINEILQWKPAEWDDSLSSLS